MFLALQLKVLSRSENLVFLTLLTFILIGAWLEVNVVVCALTEASPISELSRANALCSNNDIFLFSVLLRLGLLLITDFGTPVFCHYLITAVSARHYAEQLRFGRGIANDKIASEFKAKALAEIDQAVSSSVLGVLQICNAVALAVSWAIIAHTVYRPSLSLIVITFISLILGTLCVYKLFKWLGIFRSVHNIARYKSIDTGFRDKVFIFRHQKHNFYADDYEAKARKLATIKAVSESVRLAPRFGLESAIILLVVFAGSDFGGFAGLPGGLLALRLAPILTKLLQAAITYSLGIRATQNVVADLSERENVQTKVMKDVFYLTNHLSDPQRRLFIRNLQALSRNSDEEIISASDLFMNKGDLTLLTGRSGSGKTTFLNALAGITNCYGHIKFATSQTHVDAFTGQYIGYVPQHFYIGGASLYEAIAMDDDAVGVDKVAAVLNVCDIDSDVLKNVVEVNSSFSGGELQRVAIARELTFSPELLLLDETFSGVDASSSLRIIKNLREHFPEMSILLVMHNIPAELHAIVDRFWVAESGIVTERD